MPEQISQNVRAKGKAATRKALLEIASALLEREGASALSMRRIAKLAGCSTSVLYTQFGGKEGLAAALYKEGFEHLAAALAKVNEAKPLAQVTQLNHAYRQTALANPTHYAIMFARPIPEFQPDQVLRELAWGTLQPLINALEACVVSKKLNGDPADMAKKLWLFTHGLVSAELAGHSHEDAERMLDETVASFFKAWQRKSKI